MRDYRTTGRQSCRLSPFHQRLHAEAVARAQAMRAMLDKGMTPHEVGKHFDCTAQAVKGALKRQGLWKGA